MIQDARQTDPDVPALTAAKAKLRSAARRHSGAKNAPPVSPKQAAALIVSENPTAAAAVAFAVVAVVGPGGLFRAASFAFRAAPLVTVAWKALDSRSCQNSTQHEQTL